MEAMLTPALLDLLTEGMPLPTSAADCSTSTVFLVKETTAEGEVLR
jgi:hypothetical protein